ncbi:hypothetical protein [Bacillus pseudomycoides]|nr:hypothetical protein [Bacillus pseudomycoides]MED1476999.1 hypothetical protein [Bacillus pseudomycoides]
MKIVLSLIASVVLVGGFLFAPADNKEQPKQVAKESQNVIMFMDPGTGI